MLLQLRVAFYIFKFEVQDIVLRKSIQQTKNILCSNAENDRTLLQTEIYIYIKMIIPFLPIVGGCKTPKNSFRISTFVSTEGNLFLR